MPIKTLSAKRSVVDFLREEAPLEYERLKSIGLLDSTSNDRSGDPSGPSQISYAQWVRDV